MARPCCSNARSSQSRRSPGSALGRQLGALARSIYALVRVSILIHSPSLTNSGTATVAPVLILAGLVTLVAVSPRAPGSVSVILATMWGGREIETGLPL